MTYRQNASSEQGGYCAVPVGHPWPNRTEKQYPLGIPLPVVAGMIICGATLGDKMSPISDTTNLAAMSADTSLYRHIYSMLFTTAPTFLLTLIIFGVIGRGYGDSVFASAEITMSLSVLAALLAGIISRVERVTTLVATTLCSGLLGNMAMGEAAKNNHTTRRCPSKTAAEFLGTPEFLCKVLGAAATTEVSPVTLSY